MFQILVFYPEYEPTAALCEGAATHQGYTQERLFDTDILDGHFKWTNTSAIYLH